MKNLILLAFLLSSSSILAQQQRANVLLVDPDIDAEELQRRYNVHRPRFTQTLPDKEVRDGVLDGIEEVEKWDELKKDIFFMDLRSKQLTDLKKKYPELSEKTLKALKEKVP